MKLDFAFHGKWLIRFDPAEFPYSDILALLPLVQARLELQKLHYKRIHLHFGRTIVRNRFFPFAEQLFIDHTGNDRRLVQTDPGAFRVQAALEPLARQIRAVSLFFPRLHGDPRWKTLGLPAAQLFLASGLQAAGFAVDPQPLGFPAIVPPPGTISAEIAGFTLFEDLLPVLKPFLADFKASYDGFLAAGGPFPTLAPMAAIQHLQQVNLFVRGEAEIGLPLILEALNRGDADALFKAKGLFWQQPGLIVISDFDKVSRPETFSRFKVDLSFLRSEHLQHGLEMNFSRGCGRGCLFCCRAQGSKFRKLPLAKAEELLNEYNKKVDSLTEASVSPRQEPPPLVRGVDNKNSFHGDLSFCPPLPKGGKRGDADTGTVTTVHTPPTVSLSPRQEPPSFQTMNINDDDILQDPAYAAEIFALVKKHGFRIHGIQTSPASLLESDGKVKTSVLDLAADPTLYVDSRPLLWLGSDVFLPQRARRLGKRLPSPEGFAALLTEIEKRGLRHFHYWISSDGESSWEEFCQELALLVSFHRDFPGFGLLAHAPFVVPYPASRLFARLGDNATNLKVKLRLDAPDPAFGYSVVERLETRWPQLNSLLRNEKAGGEKGFFDFLKEKDFMAVTQGGQTNHIRQNWRMICAAAQLAYHFLKQEELQDPVCDPGLQRAQKKLEETIAELLVKLD